ncbi:molecular chaperone TorD family protein [Orbaceae bacterium ESL0727]|nr:molecular chaperone TorD family protein [Orbaceae bacterium ESL0727]
MDNITTLAKLLGAFFYYSPHSDATSPLIPALLEVDKLADWQNPTRITAQCQTLAEEIDNPELAYQFSLLFEGQGTMVAPPWGSVYLDREHLLMGESEEAYRHFLRQNNLQLDTGMNEPEDQFGLMLMAFALLRDQKKFAAADSLIHDHLLTWSSHYLTKLTENTVSPFYKALGIIADEFLGLVALSKDK